MGLHHRYIDRFTQCQTRACTSLAISARHNATNGPSRFLFEYPDFRQDQRLRTAPQEGRGCKQKKCFELERWQCLRARD